MLGVLEGLILSLVYDFLKLFYHKLEPFHLSLETQVAQMHGQHHYEFMLTQNIKNRELRKTEIKQITHEVGYPKLEKIMKERGTHTDADLPFILKGEDSKTVRITYNMREGLPKKCRIRTFVTHTYGVNKYIENINIIFK